MIKYPIDTYSNGATYPDDSLTSLNWLQNLNIMKNTSPTPPPSPITFQKAKTYAFIKHNSVKKCTTKYCTYLPTRIS
jgi:hypothetical protein